MLQYTHINHVARREMGLSVNEYIVADMIYHLSNNPSAPVLGWCTMSRPTMAKEIDFTPRGIIKLINRLCEMGIIEKNRDNYLRTGRIFYECVVNRIHTPHEKNFTPPLNSVQYPPELSSPPPLNSVQYPPELSSPNIYIYNNTDKNKDITLTPAREKIEKSHPAGKTQTAEIRSAVNPPVPAAPPFDPVVAITEKILSRQEARERWMVLNRLDETGLRAEARKAAHNWVKKQVEMDDEMINEKVKLTGSLVFISYFEGAWLPNISRFSGIPASRSIPRQTLPEPKTYKYMK
jgi:hypothetical protein